MTTLSFHGGAGTVTGSRHLLEHGKARLLIDAGLFQGLKELRLRNWDRPGFDPASLGAVLLTHTHIDHAGYLPKLVRDGFSGPIHCTEATADLAPILLMDAAKIQEEDAAYANEAGYSKHKPAEPLYTAADAERAIALLVPHPYRKAIEVAPGVRATFRNAGHILGSAMIELELAGGPRIVASGDVGRYAVPLHPDPDPLPECDVLIVESTYGDRDHDAEPLIEQIRRPFRATLGRGGAILIPSFAVARAQVVTLMLRQAMDAGELPMVPIHIDSPMAVDATRIYARHADAENLDQELAAEGRRMLFPSNVRFHRTVAESKQLNRENGPRIIISASGMLTAGRVLHHLKRLAQDPKNLIALVGYQAPGTRGRALAEGADTLRIHGEAVPVRATVVNLHGLSAHADRGELLRWIGTAPKPPQSVFVVHGEPEAAQAFAAMVKTKFGVDTHAPHLGQRYEL